MRVFKRYNINTNRKKFTKTINMFNNNKQIKNYVLNNNI